MNHRMMLAVWMVVVCAAWMFDVRSEEAAFGEAMVLIGILGSWLHKIERTVTAPAQNNESAKAQLALYTNPILRHLMIMKNGAAHTRSRMEAYRGQPLDDREWDILVAISAERAQKAAAPPEDDNG